MGRRYLVWLAAVTVVLELVALDLATRGWAAALRESGDLEWGQVLVLAGALGVGLDLVRTRAEGRALYAAIATGLAAILFREHDATFVYLALPRSVRVGALLVAGAAVLVAGRRTIVSATWSFLGRPGGALVATGLVLALAWAQLLGQPPVWRALYENIAPGRRLVEETLELAGYLLVLGGLVEERRRGSGSTR